MERSAWPKNLSSRRKRAIMELLHGQNPRKKLRDLCDAHSQAGNNTGQPLFAEDVVISVLRSFSDTPSELMSAESNEALQVPSNACVRSEVSKGSESIESPVVPRKTSNTWTRLVENLIDAAQQRRKRDRKLILNPELPRKPRDLWTKASRDLDDLYRWRKYKKRQILNSKFRRKSRALWKKMNRDLEDGRYQWRKCKKRPILNSKFTRRYYRCAHKIDQGCQATEQVQQIKDDPPVYRTTYQGPPTCKTILKSPPLIPKSPKKQNLDSPSPWDDSISLSYISLVSEQDNYKNNPTFFDFLSGNHEQKSPYEDDLHPHGHSQDDYNNNPILFDFLSVNQEQKLPSEDDMNPPGHSHGNNSNN